MKVATQSWSTVGCSSIVQSLGSEFEGKGLGVCSKVSVSGFRVRVCTLKSGFRVSDRALGWVLPPPSNSWIISII